MFQGVVPKECIAQILRVMDVEKWGSVYNCCSGTFRFEQITLATHPGVQVHSNDVSLYSSAIAGYVMGKPLDWEFTGALEFVNEFDYQEPDQRLAAFAVAFNLGRFAIGKPNAYKVKHRDHLIANFDSYVDKTLEKVRKLPGMLPIASYSPRDWIEHMDEAIERKAAIFSFPPFFKCLAPEHRLLTADMRWVPCGDLREGDELFTFDEYPQPGNRMRRWRYATVTHSSPGVKDCVRVNLDNGESIVCTADHPWLAWRDGPRPIGDRGWVEAKDLVRASKYPTRDGLIHHHIYRSVPTWTPSASFDDGWLSGIFDGEGTLAMPVGNGHGSATLAIAQAPGYVADRAVHILRSHGFDVSWSERPPQQGHHKPLRQIWINGGLPEILRALGTFRPGRLIDRMRKDVDVSLLSTRNNGGGDKIRVVDVEPLGPQPIQNISTSSGTYIGEGYLMHNSGYEKMFEFLNENTRWEAPKYEIFDPKNLRGLIDKVRSSGVPFCILSDQIYDDLKPEMEFHSGRGKPHYCYVSTGKSSFLQLTPKESPFRYTPVDIDKIVPASTVSIVPAEARHMTFLKNVYLKKGIIHTPGMANYIVHVDGMLVGGLIYALPKFGEKKSIYLLSDFAISREGRLSKLVTRLACNREILRDLGRRFINRYDDVITTAFSDHPVSMKYRGIFDLTKRVEKNEPAGRYMLNYTGARLDESPDEAFRWWYGKHFKRGN
ncbi:intein [Pseudaminobacter salicylatoxidans]|uniref:Intein n=1 Tax=Pseudaminobacter salicylatoxidans TaxID=93369 RepID=A0A316C527_PSESE|nr:Hint domain-containing protein [Pseudaminobacter salicylatoxidans]PWJ81508.1 intein [Pseudaminobacter salicylatoxidans]